MPWFSWVFSNVVLALLLVPAAWCAQRWLRRPGVAHILWLFVLVKLLTPPLVSVALGRAPGPVACALGVCGCDHHSPAQAFVRDVLPWGLSAAWAVGAGTTAWVAWRRWRRFRRLRAHARPAPAGWQALAARLAADMSLRRAPEVLVVPGRLPPLVVPGIPRPSLLVPAALAGRLDATQRTALLLHELAHVRRGDHWVRVLELVVRVVYWWLPGIGSLVRQVRDCEESCCDAAVVARLPDGRRPYAELLLTVVDFVGACPGPALPQATPMSAADRLEQRLCGILEAGRAERRTWPVAAVALALAFAILPSGLHYELGGRRPPASEQPAAGVAESPVGTSDDALRSALCCPS